MRSRTIHLFAAGLLLLLLAYALPGPEPPATGRGATFLGAAASLWEDGDLRFGAADRERLRRLWRDDVRGLALVEGRPQGPGAGPPAATGYLYAVRPVYPAVAAPAYGLLGPRGPRVLNSALFAAVLWIAWRLLRHPSGPSGRRGDRGRRPRSGLVVPSTLFASAVLAHVLQPTPATFEMACVFVGVALWCRVRERAAFGRRELLPLAGAGLLLALALASRPELGIVALAPAADLAWSRRFKAAGVLVLVGGAAAGLLVWAQGDLPGDWRTGPVADAVIDGGPLPGEVGFEPSEVAHRVAPAAGGGPVLRDLWYLLVGRHVGLVPYFPFALFAVGLYAGDLRRRGNRSGHLLTAALLVYGGILALDLPGVAASPSAPGLAAIVAVYPVFLLLPKRVRAGWSVLLPFAAAGLWTVPALVSAASPASPSTPGLQARAPAFRALPLEATLLAAGELPGYVPWSPPGRGSGEEGVWLVPGASFFTAEPNPEGVWVRGASRSEIYVAVPGRAEPAPVRLRLGSVAAESTVTLVGADGRTIVRFDSPAKRSGTPVEVRPEPVISGIPIAALGGREGTLGRIVLTVSGGAIPAHRSAASDDPRYLGVFLGL